MSGDRLVGLGHGGLGRLRSGALEPFLESIEVQINDRGGEQREHLTENEPAYDGNA